MRKLFLALIVSFQINLLADIISKDSYYNINSVWLSQESKEVQLKDFSGKKIIIGMMYTGCPHACPMIIAKIKDIETAMQKLGVNNYHVILASFDTKRDLPENLNKYMLKRKIDQKKWSFLYNSNDAKVRELAVALGVNYKQLSDGEFSHSNVISLLNEKGERVAFIESLTSDISNFVQAAK